MTPKNVYAPNFHMVRMILLLTSRTMRCVEIYAKRPKDHGKINYVWSVFRLITSKPTSLQIYWLSPRNMAVFDQNTSAEPWWSASSMTHFDEFWKNLQGIPKDIVHLRQGNVGSGKEFDSSTELMTHRGEEVRENCQKTVLILVVPREKLFH